MLLLRVVVVDKLVCVSCVCVGTGNVLESKPVENYGWTPIVNQLINSATSTEGVHDALADFLPPDRYFRSARQGGTPHHPHTPSSSDLAGWLTGSLSLVCLSVCGLWWVVLLRFNPTIENISIDEVGHTHPSTTTAAANQRLR